ncbi:MAG: hypothetical protein KDC53_24555, partial [Saprospiraceae bacterium]|nr:hypothetical protein [Saprospiraceae bacterium]
NIREYALGFILRDSIAACPAVQDFGRRVNTGTLQHVQGRFHQFLMPVRHSQPDGHHKILMHSPGLNISGLYEEVRA